MDWFPQAYPDESFYSELVRLHRYLGAPPYANFARAISGRRHYVALAHLPCGFSGIAEHFGWSDEKLEEVIRQTTTIGYHTAFASQAVRDEALAQMKGQGASLQFTLGLSTFPVPMPQTLQFCRGCIADQLRETGEAWWRRSQQLPGVIVCVDHGTWLRKSSAEMVRENRHLLIGPAEAVEASYDDPATVSRGQPPPKLLDLAILSQDLLNEAPVPRGPKDLYRHYRQLLADRGLLRGTQHLRFSRIQELLRDCWGDVLEAVTGLSLTAQDRPNWIRELLRNNRSLAPPAQHLALQAALKQAAQVERPFGSPPWPCLNPLAEHFEKPVVIHQRLIRHRGKLHGHFSCDCGYSYSLTRRQDGTIGRAHLREFGPTAVSFLRSASCRGLSLRGKARAMRVDPKTVIRIERDLHSYTATQGPLGGIDPPDCQRNRRQTDC